MCLEVSRLHLRDDKPVRGRKINWTKAGFLESDVVLTVSPNYAKEMASGVERGVELDDVIRETGCKGSTNGMDTQEWDPSADKYIDVLYDAKTVLEAKPILQKPLQAEFGLPLDPNVPLFGFIGRLEEQKGSDILAKMSTESIEDDVQLVVLGTGKKDLGLRIWRTSILRKFALLSNLMYLWLI